MYKCSHYKIVIVRGHGSNATNTKTNIPDNTLLPESQSQTSYYVAAATRVEEFQSVFLIGDGQTYLLYSERFVNVPLSIDQEYMVFIRLYSSLNVSYHTLLHVGGRLKSAMFKATVVFVFSLYMSAVFSF